MAGTVATLVFLVIYCLIAMAIGGAFVVGRPAAFEIGYFIIAGTAWLPIVMIIIRWMSAAGCPLGRLDALEAVPQSEGRARRQHIDVTQLLEIPVESHPRECR